MAEDGEELLDALAVAAHPDDAEIGAGGTLATLAARGYRVGVLDLTVGDLASNGTVEQRSEEAARAARELGLVWRRNAGLPEWPRQTEPAARAVVEALRRYRPVVLLAPYPEDEHPGHAWAGCVAVEARHLAGLARWTQGGPPYRPPVLWHYFIHGETSPSVVVDVSEQYERKRAALAAYASQFTVHPGAVITRLNSGAFLRLVESRDRHFGGRIGCEFGEGFWSAEPVAVREPKLLVFREGGER